MQKRPYEKLHPEYEYEYDSYKYSDRIMQFSCKEYLSITLSDAVFHALSNAISTDGIGRISTEKICFCRSINKNVVVRVKKTLFRIHTCGKLQ